jgi:alanyl-tRNA synthetase
MTKKLFHQDSYQTTFQAKIVAKFVDKGKHNLILDQTYFYPNAGGQTCDRGKINGITVIDVQEENGRVIHYLERDIVAEIGATVSGEVDWKERFDHMQQHTGQHILSGALMNLWQQETLSFHMGEDACTLDIPFTMLDEKKVDILEVMLNRIICENRPIHQYFAKDNSEITPEKLRKLDKKHEKLRIIEIDKFDRTACGGTHCRYTGEIGIIKITGWENRKDKTRIFFLCGYRALADYQKKHRVTRNVSNMLTTGLDQLEEKITRLSQEKKHLNKQVSRMEKTLLQFETEELKEQNGWEQNGLHFITRLFPEKSLQSLQQIAFRLTDTEKKVIILGAEKPEPVICLSCSRDLSFHSGKLMIRIMNEYQGKGGGSAFMAMGKFEKKDNIQKALEKAIDFFLEENQ